MWAFLYFSLMFHYFHTIFFSSFMLLPCWMMNFIDGVFSCVFRVTFVAVCSVVVFCICPVGAKIAQSA
jgi:hypothetical protein